MVGIPLTEARNHFNKGVRYYEALLFEDARQEFETSLRIWDSAETKEYLQKTNESIDKDLFVD